MLKHRSAASGMAFRALTVFSLAAVAWPIGAAGCAAPPRTASAVRASSTDGAAPLAGVEAAYQETRLPKDQLDVTRARGADRTPDGTPLAELVHRYRMTRAGLLASLAAIDITSLGAGDRRALTVMRRTVERELVEEGIEQAATADSVDCRYDPAELARAPHGLRMLTERVYACYGRVARRIELDGETLDRLTILGLLPRTDDAARRRRLFLALDPVWRSVNGDGGPASPFRRLVALSAARWQAGDSYVERNIRELGLEPRMMEEWLTGILARWRDVTPPQMLEPWDYYYAAGKASRVLSPRISRSHLLELNHRYFAALGADPKALRIQYDLDPRSGKTPVAFATFGARNRWLNGRWVPGEPWVFATYRVGGLDNLGELLHETGHGIHIAAIRTRPAYVEWPDSDPYTEGLGDLVAMEMYEPAWQMHYLGDSVSTAESLRAKYYGVMLDIAWALFEVRMHRTPDADPNVVWTDITRDYLRIVPHPEWSWWAMRGQLVNSPGYMMNYAVGSIIVADLRDRIRALHGPMTPGDPTWYPWVSQRLYRFGLERPSREVITEFLGRPVSPRALMDDLRRIAAGVP